MLLRAKYSQNPFVRQFTTILIVTVLMVYAAIHPAHALELQLGSEVYQVEVAQTMEQRRQGLMFRQQLGPRQGMLFVYPQSGDHRIWMKNMLIPLQVYWIDANFSVIGVRRLEPCHQAPCPVYSMYRESQYVLELGDYQHSLAVGDRLVGVRIE